MQRLRRAALQFADPQNNVLHARRRRSSTEQAGRSSGTRVPRSENARCHLDAAIAARAAWAHVCIVSSPEVDP